MTSGLIMYVVVISLNVIGLIIDAIIHFGYGGMTITEVVQRYPLFGYLIIFLDLVGIIGLGFHFYVKQR